MKNAALALLLLVAITGSSAATEPTIETLTGATMGTTYSIKIFNPPELQDIQFEIDSVLRRVNDQMSTYLETSEISRFNRSVSTDWFSVSPEFAEVVQYAQSVSTITEGAFDITVGPLVNAWSFGPDEKTNTVPPEATIEHLLEQVGYNAIQVRAAQPALKKSIPELTIDLSAIAKGHAVDRIVEFLNQQGANDVFVEIGGEVRVSGNKAGQWWKVGIQVPDSDQTEVMIAHSLGTGGGDDQAMATSGDYRNFFEVDGIRYSHSIDPRTGRPVNHDVASVSVIAKTCMVADAWATAINVLGTEEGLDVAKQAELDVLVVRRTDAGFVRMATGAMTAHASDPLAKIDPPQAVNNSVVVLLITFVAFAVMLFAMSVGVLFGRKSISGSCGGAANQKDADGNISCSLCSNPDDACKDLRRRMQQSETS